MILLLPLPSASSAPRFQSPRLTCKLTLKGEDGWRVETCSCSWPASQGEPPSVPVDQLGGGSGLRVGPSREGWPPEEQFGSGARIRPEASPVEVAERAEMQGNSSKTRLYVHTGVFKLTTLGAVRRGSSCPRLAAS